ncbi:MAG: ECF-type sigma factor [Planctomycetaceae bacterium]
MDPSHSVTRLIAGLKIGDEDSAQALWTRFFDRISQLASRKLSGLPRRVQDEEDLALSALHALCQGAREGRFRQFETRGDLWQILVMITSRKAANLRRKQNVRQERGESALHAAGATKSFSLSEVVEGPPSAAMVDELGVCCEELLSLLPEKLQQVAMMKLAGHTNQEIANARGRGLSTIERYLQLIRAHWANHIDN